MNNNELIKTVTEAILKQLQYSNKQTDFSIHSSAEKRIPVGVSNHHLHLSQEDLIKLFGAGKELTILRDLSQPGQFACKERVTLVGPKGVVENVRILGPIRTQTQIELLVSDCIKLGIMAPIRDSGDLKGTPGLTLVGPKGAVTINEGAIIVARHIHMHPRDGVRYGVKDGERVNVKVSGPRGLIFNEVLVRISEKYRLEMHVDFDEANAAGLTNDSLVEIVKF